MEADPACFVLISIFPAIDRISAPTIKFINVYSFGVRIAAILILELTLLVIGCGFYLGYRDDANTIYDQLIVRILLLPFF